MPMKILVVYHSLTGNTESIAREIADECGASGTVKIMPLEKVSPLTLAEHEIVFLGSPCHGGDLSQPVKDYLHSIPEGVPIIIAGFFTHAAPVDENQDFQQCLTTYDTISTEKGITLAGIFHCQGFLTPDLHYFIRESRNISDNEWAGMLADMKGHPDESDRASAREFARSIVQHRLR